MEERIEFSISGVHIMSKRIFPLTEKNPIPALFHYDIKLETRVQPDHGFIIINVMVVIQDNQNKESIFADYSIWCIFPILEFSKHIIQTDNGEYSVPGTLENMIRPVAISTVRGIIYSDLKNSYLQHTIMPIVFMAQT